MNLKWWHWSGLAATTALLGAGAVYAAGRRSDAAGVTVAQLRTIMPGLSAERAAELLPYLLAALAAHQVSTPRRRAAFLAQLGFESGSLRYFEEKASGEAYEGRESLGNTQPGDGVRYKGRGPIQLTGRANYRAAGKALSLDLEGTPSLAALPHVGFRVAGWFWESRGLNALADVGTAEAFREITRRINGGFNGLAERESYWARAKAALGGVA
ncbi:glycoside hydrolase family 19 protein [Archangium sp.]|uniref:glycoside hydrolase family 19 protein n=1 Tax=Archangium sp. TaxID=1872627 RepID=UPI00286CA8E3|nr:glycoside hydrolase family 19 protein [Archangium sp.]